MKGEFRVCEFCRCHTNARLRACCELGHVKDLGRLESERLTVWMNAAREWLPDANGRYPGDSLDDPGAIIATFAGEVMLLGEEVERMRELRGAVGKLSQQLGVERRLVEALSRPRQRTWSGEEGAGMLNLARKQQKRIEELMEEERKAVERANRLARMLSEALEVLEESGRYGDGGLAKLRAILTSEEDSKENLHGLAIEAWSADAEGPVGNLACSAHFPGRVQGCADCDLGLGLTAGVEGRGDG